MGLARTKFVIPVSLYETANNNRLRTGSGLTASLYYGGAQVEAATTINPGGGTITLSSRGDIPTGSNVILVESDGTEKGTGLSLTSIVEVVSSDLFVATIGNSGSAVTVSIGDRLCCRREANNRPTIYEDQNDSSDTLSNPMAVPQNGVLEGYINTDSVDIYLSGSEITDGWWFYNWPCQANRQGPWMAKAETKTAAATVPLEPDTVIVFVSGATPIVDIEQCEEGRCVLVVPTASGVTLTTTATSSGSTNNEIRVTGSPALTLDAYRPIMLVGHNDGTSIMWYPMEVLSEQALDDLSDATVSGTPANPSILVSTGGDFQDQQTVGTAADPLQGAVILHSGFKLVNASGFTMQFDTSALAGNVTLTLDAASGGELLTANGVHSITSGAKTFNDDVLLIRDNISLNKYIRFVASGITAGQTRQLTVQDKNYTIADAAGGDYAANGLTDFNDGDAAAEKSDHNPVVWSATEALYFPSDQLGEWNNPIEILYTNGLRISPVSAPLFDTDYISILSAGGAGSYGTVRLPTIGAGGDHYFMLDGVAQTITGVKTYNDDAMVLRDPSDTTRKGRFDAANVTIGATRIHSLADRDVDIEHVGDHRIIVLKDSIGPPDNDGLDDHVTSIANGYPIIKVPVDVTLQRVIFSVSTITKGAPDITLQLYHASSLPTASTIPPAGTAILGSAAALSGTSAGGLVELVNETTGSMSDSTIPANNWIYLAAASGSAWITFGWWHLQLEYRMD